MNYLSFVGLLSVVKNVISVMIYSTYKFIGEKCITCTCKLHFRDIGMYHGDCENCAKLRWSCIPKKCNFIYDEDIHENTISDFSHGWCSNEMDPQFGMCHRCSLCLYRYFCFHKFEELYETK